MTIHDIAPIRNPGWFRRDFALLYRWMLPRLCARAIVVVTDTPDCADELARLGASERVRIVSPGIAPTFRPAAVEDVNTVRKLLKLGDAPYALALGSIEPRKNLERLIEAWLCLGEKRGDSVLVIAGGMNEKVFGDGLRLAEHGIRRVGYVDDVLLPGLLSGAQLFASVPLYEGFGLPPLEAMASGTPVVVSDIAAHRWTMQGTLATFVDPTDVASIAAGIEAALFNPPTVDDAQIRHRFNWEAAAAGYDAVFSSLGITA